MIADFIAFLANSLTITVLVAYVFALWAALVAWAWIDISGRTDNILYKLGAVLVVATGAILGFAIYLLLRPNLTKDEAALHELEEAILASQAHWQACPKCNHVVREDFVYCSNCSYKLSVACSSCGKDVNSTWNVCPYCGRKQKDLDLKTIQIPVRAAFRNPGVVILSSINYLIKKLNENRSAIKEKPGAVRISKSKKATTQTKRKRA
ncbi:MAG: hypothetical protein A2Z11_03080 [Candidatus Woykebacteria bacterium RBG_16_43_9]|uniref:DZANK-type domain-containing protein n=1 Tax=Candidatus Woykebacteria bacterium RBG_16_43_9 TaxID=1802596 RepID=A0A1G1WC85_9BACT|nr:MAG: hypothetical protein A2Z11_03080 [Candidatus Woykebacteria bacterium RBG_16_43_9]